MVSFSCVTFMSFFSRNLFESWERTKSAGSAPSSPRTRWPPSAYACEKKGEDRARSVRVARFRSKTMASISPSRMRWRLTRLVNTSERRS